MQPQNLQLARDVQPVPALRLDRRRSIRREFPQRRHRPLLQSLRCRRAQLLHRIQNPAALARNLLVARAGNLQFVLFRAARRMNQVRMRIHKSRQHHAPLNIQLLRAARLRQRLNFRTHPDRSDAAVAHQQRPIFHDSEIRKRLPAPRTASAQREHLRSPSYEKGIRSRRRVLCPKPAPSHSFQPATSHHPPGVAPYQM